MLSVNEALSEILSGAKVLPAQTVSFLDCCGRVTATDIYARLTQPPFDASAMDGYAVRKIDAEAGNSLNVIGEAAAGGPFAGVIGDGDAVRIFTGAIVPAGADHVIIQEDVTRTGNTIIINEAQPGPSHIRQAGLDFQENDLLVGTGMRLHHLHGAVIAAANIEHVSVVRKPVVAFFTNGNELRAPGSMLNPGDIINSNSVAMESLFTAWGGAATDLGVAPDEVMAVEACFNAGRGADVIVPVGGASVGDHDVVKSAFVNAGGQLIFEKVRVKPGKPTWFGKLGNAWVVGLPGNPASAIVCAALFVKPLIQTLGGLRRESDHLFITAKLVNPIPANGPRESYLRAELSGTGPDARVVPAPIQDSGLLSPFLTANALVRRLPGAPGVASGETVEVMSLL